MIFPMLYDVVIISIIHRNCDELLLAKRLRHPDKDMWGLLGGKAALTKNPDPFQAITIEVEEDIRCQFIPKFFTLEFELRTSPHLLLYFEGEIVGEPIVRNDTKTIQEISWFPIDEALDMELAFGETTISALRKFAKLNICRRRPRGANASS